LFPDRFEFNYKAEELSSIQALFVMLIVWKPDHLHTGKTTVIVGPGSRQYFDHYIILPNWAFGPAIILQLLAEDEVFLDIIMFSIPVVCPTSVLVFSVQASICNIHTDSEIVSFLFSLMFE